MRYILMLALGLFLGSCHEEICDDGDRCTVDSWNYKVSACQYEAIPCMPSDTCHVCFCVGGEIRENNICGYTPPDSCDDGDACTVDSMDANGYCVYSLVDCEDAVACTNDNCLNGICEHPEIKCNDEDPLTLNDRCEDGYCVYDDSIGVSHQRILAALWNSQKR